MTSRKSRKPVSAAEKPRKDRITTARKVQLEEMQAKEADVELRSVLGAARHVSVVCPHCHFESDHDLDSRVPMARCPNCSKPIGLQVPGTPQVVSR